MNLYDHPNYVSVKPTPLDSNLAIWALKEAWLRLFEEYISPEALCVLAAQSALETDRWQKINNNNFGNLKMIDGKQFTMFATGENIWNNKLKKSEWKWFEPPHFQTAFRSYDNVIDGAVDYIKFISDRQCSEEWRNKAYKKAFEFLRQGKPKEFSYALHDAGYYTANPETYTTGVLRLFKEFLRKKDELMSWKPEEKDTDPSPPPEPEVEEVEDKHDTDHDLEPPVQDPEELIDTQISNEVPKPPKQEDKMDGNMVVVLAFALGGVGTFIMWLLQAC